MFKYQKNYKTNYNQRKVDTNLEVDNTFEIAIKTTDVIEVITVKNCIRVVTKHQLNSFQKGSNKLLQIIFKLPISMTIGYNSIQNEVEVCTKVTLCQMMTNFGVIYQIS